MIVMRFLAGKYSGGGDVTARQSRDDVGFYPYKYGYAFEAIVHGDSKNVRTGGLEKHYAMGRRAGSGVTVMPDGKTVYMTDASRQATLTKFVASEAGSLASGELFCAKFVANQPSSVIEHNWLAGFVDAEQRRVIAHAGDTINFTWATGNHDVWLLKDQTAFATCDFTDAVKIGDASPTPYTVLDPRKTYFFSCNKPNHCNNGQKIAVTVAPSKPHNVQQPAPNHGNLDYNRAGVSDGQSSYSIEWISMGHASDEELVEAIEKTRFQDLFEDARVGTRMAPTRTTRPSRGAMATGISGPTAVPTGSALGLSPARPSWRRASRRSAMLPTSAAPRSFPTLKASRPAWSTTSSMWPCPRSSTASTPLRTRFLARSTCRSKGPAPAARPHAPSSRCLIPGGVRPCVHALLIPWSARAPGGCCVWMGRKQQRVRVHLCARR